MSIKTALHPRNKHRNGYDFSALVNVHPALSEHIIQNKHNQLPTVNFSKAEAVKALNVALLKKHYQIEHWDFPDENLCPPIPGRADYLHHIADLLSENNNRNIPLGDKITCLDVGTGASCIYPIIGVTEYDWRFIGSDIDPKSIASAQNIINSNPTLNGKIECRLQQHPKHIFLDIIKPGDKIDITLCNPPFHSSLEDAQKVTQRKIKNLSK